MLIKQSKNYQQAIKTGTTSLTKGFTALASKGTTALADGKTLLGSLKNKGLTAAEDIANVSKKEYSTIKQVATNDSVGFIPTNLQFFAEKTKKIPDTDIIKGGRSVKLDTYKSMFNDPTVTGQEHHLSQNAAFRDVIPKQEGLSIELNGNAFTEVGSQHYNAHSSLEGFWNNYRKGGYLYGEIPTVGEYNRALYNSLENAGISKSDSAYSVLETFKQQRGFGLNNSDLVPRIPGRINQVQ